MSVDYTRAGAELRTTQPFSAVKRVDVSLGDFDVSSLGQGTPPFRGCWIEEDGTIDIVPIGHDTDADAETVWLAAGQILPVFGKSILTTSSVQTINCGW